MNERQGKEKFAITPAQDQAWSAFNQMQQCDRGSFAFRQWRDVGYAVMQVAISEKIRAFDRRSVEQNKVIDSALEAKTNGREIPLFEASK